MLYSAEVDEISVEYPKDGDCLFPGDGVFAEHTVAVALALPLDLVSDLRVVHLGDVWDLIAVDQQLVVTVVNWPVLQLRFYASSPLLCKDLHPISSLAFLEQLVDVRKWIALCESYLLRGEIKTSQPCGFRARMKQTTIMVISVEGDVLFKHHWSFKLDG